MQDLGRLMGCQGLEINTTEASEITMLVRKYSLTGSMVLADKTLLPREGASCWQWEGDIRNRDAQCPPDTTHSMCKLLLLASR